jgi:aspartate ammonia-lyase
VRGISIDVIGECSKIGEYSRNGQLQLNAYLPFILNCFVNIHELLIKSIDIFCSKFLNKITLNKNKIEKNLSSSYVLLNILLPELGYNKIKEIYKIIEKKNPKTVAEFKKIIFEETHLDEEFIEDYFESANATSFLKRKKK